MIELEPRKQDFLQSIPNEMKYESDPTWWEGFSATVAYNNMPLLESVEETYKFGALGVDPTFKISDHIEEKYLPYYKDLARAKNVQHLRYLEQRVQSALDRRNVMNNAGITSQIAGGIVDPLFLTSFVPMLNAVTLGRTVGGAALKLGAIGAGYGAASEARRAPFAVADEDYESAMNIASTTALSALTGGVLKGATYTLPFMRSTAAKARAAVTGKPVKHFIDEKGNMSVSRETDTPFNAKFYNPFGSPIQRLLSDKSIPQDVKEELVKLSYNSSVGLQGTAQQAMPQSVAQRMIPYDGMVREFHEEMANLYEGHAFGREKAGQFFGAFTREMNPADNGFEEFVEDTFRRYILANSPDPQVARQARTALSDQQKKAFTLIKKFFDDFDADARFVGVLRDDAKIQGQMSKIDDLLDKKAKLVADIEDTVKAKAGGTKKQMSKLKDLENEMVRLRLDRDLLEEALQTRTRKSFLFPIYYDKMKLQDAVQRKNLEDIFDQHYALNGDESPREAAERTLSRIMEENADEMEDGRAVGNVGRGKHLKFRKTDINEYQIADYMVLNMDAIYTYAKRMGGKIEFARAYGGKNVDEVLSSIEDSMRKAKLSEDKIAQVKTAFTGEHDRVMGALIRDPSALNRQLSKFSKSYAGWAYLGGAGISAVSDLGTVVMSHGYADVAKAGLATLTDANLKTLAFKEMRYAGAGLDMARNIVQQKYLGDSVKSIQPNALERVQNVGDRFMYTMNGLGMITTAYKVLDGVLINDKFIRLSRKLLANNIDEFDKEYLFRYGIDEELAEYITKMPVEQAEGSDFLLANTGAWPRNTAAERNLLRRYQAATASHSDNAVVMGQAFDRPLIMDGVVYLKDNPFFAGMRKKFPNMFAIDERASTASVKMVRIENGTMTLPFTFMNFAMGANNKILGAVLDPARKYRLQGATALIGLSVLSFQIKDRYWWRKLKSDAGEDWTRSPDLMARIIDHSGLLGIYSDLGYTGLGMVANYAGTDGKQWPISPKYISRDKQDRFMDGITEPFGAPVGLGLNVIRGVNDFMDGNVTEGSREIVNSLPFLGLPLLFSDMKELMISQGRY